METYWELEQKKFFHWDNEEVTFGHENIGVPVRTLKYPRYIRPNMLPFRV